jgi:hypothetical protein
VPPPLSGGKGVVSKQYCFNIGLYSPFLTAETLGERAAGKLINTTFVERFKVVPTALLRDLGRSYGAASPFYVK